MEHFHLPLGMWLIGIILSVLCFIVEITIHRRTKANFEIPIKEPGVTQSTPESGDEQNSVVEDIKH